MELPAPAYRQAQGGELSSNVLSYYRVPLDPRPSRFWRDGARSGRVGKNLSSSNERALPFLSLTFNPVLK
jgi:hypothetical protein